MARPLPDPAERNEVRQEPIVRGLSAGGRWIRTSSTAARGPGFSARARAVTPTKDYGEGTDGLHDLYGAFPVK